jgi:hypothetical protein
MDEIRMLKNLIPRVCTKQEKRRLRARCRRRFEKIEKLRRGSPRAAIGQAMIRPLPVVPGSLFLFFIYLFSHWILLISSYFILVIDNQVTEADSSENNGRMPRLKRRRVIASWRIPTPAAVDRSLADNGDGSSGFSRYDVAETKRCEPFMELGWACGSADSFEPFCNLDYFAEGFERAMDRIGDLHAHRSWGLVYRYMIKRHHREAGEDCAVQMAGLSL